MGYAAKAMKAAHDNMDIDKVDELMQDIADQQELAEEISTAISKPVGFGEEFDEVSDFMPTTPASQLMPRLPLMCS